MVLDFSDTIPETVATTAKTAMLIIMMIFFIFFFLYVNYIGYAYVIFGYVRHNLSKLSSALTCTKIKTRILGLVQRIQLFVNVF